MRARAFAGAVVLAVSLVAPSVTTAAHAASAPAIQTPALDVATVSAAAPAATGRRCAWGGDGRIGYRDFTRVCAALKSGDVRRLVKLCRDCTGDMLATVLPKWSTPSYRRAMLRALESDGFGADVQVWPGFAQEFFQREVGLSRYRKYDSNALPRVGRVLGLEFPRVIPSGWRPAYSGPAVMFVYDVAASLRTDSPVYRFAGTFDYGAQLDDGSWCAWPSQQCS